MDPKRLMQPSPRSERTRIIAMGVLLAMLVFLFLYLRRPQAPPPEGTADDFFVPRLDPENAPPAAKVDPGRLAEVRDATPADRVLREQGPLQHLLEESMRSVPGDFRRLKASRLDSKLYDEILANPDTYRGQPLVAKGFFSWAVEEVFPFQVEGIQAERSVWHGLLQDDLGHRFSFVVTEKPENIAEGTVVRLEGFFFKKAAIFSPRDEQDLVDPTLSIVGPRLVRSYLRMEPVQQLSPALLATVRDAELLESMELPEEALYHTLSFLQNVDADVLQEHAMDCTAAALKASPDLYRGQAVRVLGTFYETWPRSLGNQEGENPLEIPFVYHGLLVHSGPTFTYIISEEKEPDWVTRKTDVIVEGIFLKRYLYQARNGESITCPLIVVKRYQPFIVDSSAVRNLLFYFLLGLGIFMLSWFLWSTFGDRKANEAYRRRYFQMKKKQMAAQRAAAGPSEPDPKGP